jgi:hypothetical protein
MLLELHSDKIYNAAKNRDNAQKGKRINYFALCFGNRTAQIVL